MKTTLTLAAVAGTVWGVLTVGSWIADQPSPDQRAVAQAEAIVRARLAVPGAATFSGARLQVIDGSTVVCGRVEGPDVTGIGQPVRPWIVAGDAAYVEDRPGPFTTGDASHEDFAEAWSALCSGAAEVQRPPAPMPWPVRIGHALLATWAGLLLIAVMVAGWLCLVPPITTEEKS